MNKEIILKLILRMQPMFYEWVSSRELYWLYAVNEGLQTEQQWGRKKSRKKHTSVWTVLILWVCDFDSGSIVEIFLPVVLKQYTGDTYLYGTVFWLRIEDEGHTRHLHYKNDCKFSVSRSVSPSSSIHIYRRLITVVMAKMRTTSFTSAPRKIPSVKQKICPVSWSSLEVNSNESSKWALIQLICKVNFMGA